MKSCLIMRHQSKERTILYVITSRRIGRGMEKKPGNTEGAWWYDQRVYSTAQPRPVSISLKKQIACNGIANFQIFKPPIKKRLSR
jgi:hypothetical protein